MFRSARLPAIALGLTISATVLGCTRTASAQRDTTIGVVGDSVRMHLVDVELQTALQVLAKYLDRPIVLGSVGNARVTIETPRAIARSDVPRLLRGVIESQGLEMVLDTSAQLYRVRPKEPPRPIPAPPSTISGRITPVLQQALRSPNRMI